MSETFDRVQALVAEGQVRISDHGYDELAEDAIIADDVLAGAAEAIIVEDYPSAVRSERFGVACRPRWTSRARALGNPEGTTRPGRLDHRVSPRSNSLVGRFQKAHEMRTRKTIKLIHEGKFAAEVPVELIEDETGWSPYLSVEDVKKLDAVRLSLKEGDVAAAAKFARVFELLPVSA